MDASHQLADRQTTADQVYDALHEQIVSLKLTPGSRISEAQVAAEFGVSRQPVREAFNRLGAAGLLLIRPQRGTQVQKFSLAEIAAARFVRLAVELELISEAARRWTGDLAADFLRVLAAQADAARRMDRAGFHTLDEDFHELITRAAGHPAAFAVIKQNKAQLDRLCVLSLKNADEMTLLIEDHRAIYDALTRQDAAAAHEVLRRHLTRISATIDTVRAKHAEYFAE